MLQTLPFSCEPLLDIASNSVVVYLRLLTSAQIRADPDEYAPFLFHPELGIQMEPQEFCENFVESVGKEAGQCYHSPMPYSATG